ncbi:unnamed protein product, partial [Closterium sp. NIES-53]
ISPSRFFNLRPLEYPPVCALQETAWAVSNMTAGDSWQKAAVIGGDTGGMGEAGKASRLYELLVHLLRTSPFDIKREVAFAL